MTFFLAHAKNFRLRNLLGDVISASKVFFDLDPEKIKRIVDEGRKTLIGKGNFLFFEGDRANHFFLIQDGKMRLLKDSEKGKSIVIRYLKKGEILGIVAALKEVNYPVSAEAIEDTHLISWDKNSIIRLMKAYPELAVNVLRIVIDRFIELQTRYLELSTENVKKRVGRTLLRLTKELGKRVGDEIVLDLPVTREDLAEYCGTTLFTVSRTLNMFQRKGWIIAKRKKIIIKDPHALTAFVEEF